MCSYILNGVELNTEYEYPINISCYYENNL